MKWLLVQCDKEDLNPPMLLRPSPKNPGGTVQSALGPVGSGLLSPAVYEANLLVYYSIQINCAVIFECFCLMKNVSSV